MGVLTERAIRLNARAAGKADAIEQAGQLLVGVGCVAPAYVAGMVAREQIASNYLGNGISIPHGRFEDLKHVYHPGLSVLQLPEGVEWDPGETAHLVIGLAAVSGEYIAILDNLVDLFTKLDDIAELVHTNDPAAIVNRLTRA